MWCCTQAINMCICLYIIIYIHTCIPVGTCPPPAFYYKNKSITFINSFRFITSAGEALSFPKPLRSMGFAFLAILRPKTNMAPKKKNTPLKKKKHLQTTNFWVPCYFSGVYTHSSKKDFFTTFRAFALASSIDSAKS